MREPSYSRRELAELSGASYSAVREAVARGELQLVNKRIPGEDPATTAFAMRQAVRLAHKLDPPVAVSQADVVLPFADRMLRAVFYSKAANTPALADWRACYKLAVHAQGLRLRCAKRIETRVSGSLVRAVADRLLVGYRRLVTDGAAEIATLLGAFEYETHEARGDLIRGVFSTFFRSAKSDLARYLEENPVDVDPNPAADSDLDVYLHTTLRALLKEFGSPREFEDWLKGARDLAIAHERDIQNAIASGKLVARDWAQAIVFDAFDAAAIRLLNDTAGTIARRVQTVKADNARRVIVDLIAAQLRPLEDALERDLKRLK